MMEQTEHHDSPHDALIKALERVEQFERILIIYEGKEGSPSGSFDSDLTLGQCLYLTKLFEHWMMMHVLGRE
jgi:hypothetical protein